MKEPNSKPPWVNYLASDGVVERECQAVCLNLNRNEINKVLKGKFLDFNFYLSFPIALLFLLLIGL